jgi:hypothetical protein
MPKISKFTSSAYLLVLPSSLSFFTRVSEPTLGASNRRRLFSSAHVILATLLAAVVHFSCVRSDALHHIPRPHTRTPAHPRAQPLSTAAPPPANISTHEVSKKCAVTLAVVVNNDQAKNLSYFIFPAAGRLAM